MPSEFSAEQYRSGFEDFAFHASRLADSPEKREHASCLTLPIGPFSEREVATYINSRMETMGLRKGSKELKRIMKRLYFEMQALIVTTSTLIELQIYKFQKIEDLSELSKSYEISDLLLSLLALCFTEGIRSRVMALWFALPPLKSNHPKSDPKNSEAELSLATRTG